MRRFYETKHLSCGRFAVIVTDMADDPEEMPDSRNGATVEMVLIAESALDARQKCALLKKTYNAGKTHERKNIARRLAGKK